MAFAGSGFFPPIFRRPAPPSPHIIFAFVVCGAPHPVVLVLDISLSPSLYLGLCLRCATVLSSGFLQASPPVRELDQGRTLSFPRMPSDGSPQDRQSLSYLLRSGFAGGVAGCVVCLLLPSASTHPLTVRPLRSVCSLSCHFLNALVRRRRRSSRRSTESRFSSRRPTPSSRSMLVRPLLYPTQAILPRRIQG